MCGIVGAVAGGDVAPLLVDGLKRLEYRGYDSAGVAVLGPGGGIERQRVVGKVRALDEALRAAPLHGSAGIGHTRWATHGVPAEKNAHPHICQGRVTLVHNGIIENHEALRAQQQTQGYDFTSDTDTEVIVHQVHGYLARGMSLLAAVQATTRDLKGAFALGVMSTDAPGEIVAARQGSPLVIGLGEGEHFLASDPLALLAHTRRFQILEDGDTARITRDGVQVFDAAGQPAARAVHLSSASPQATERGPYRHFMLKEIHEQPQVIAETLEGRLSEHGVLEQAFGVQAPALFDRVKSVQLLACGTSYHAALVARNWFEGLAGIPCRVEVASEFRYRHPVPSPDALVVAISQSGETADTLAACAYARELGFGPLLAIVNVPESSLARAADLMLLTRAGPEIGVASTKAFTTQLAALLMLVLALGRRFRLTPEREAVITGQLRALPRCVEQTLLLEPRIRAWAERFVDKQHALFLGRGVQYPVALEGALKLKEISYIHAEGYPAGELKHGPLALVDGDMPVIAVAPNDELVEKLKSNLQEVRARGGELYVFAGRGAQVREAPGVNVIEVPACGGHVTPLLFTIPLQLLAYHVAVLRGTDVDQPRNLAKSVTVE